MTTLLTCYGDVNGRQTVPHAELQAFLCFLQRTTISATYICDATAVSKGFRRLRASHNIVSRGQDLWTPIQEASAQRAVKVETPGHVAGAGRGPRDGPLLSSAGCNRPVLSDTASPCLMGHIEWLLLKASDVCATRRLKHRTIARFIPAWTLGFASRAVSMAVMCSSNLRSPVQESRTRRGETVCPALAAASCRSFDVPPVSSMRDA